MHLINSGLVPATIDRVSETISRVPGTIERVPENSVECLRIHL
jgi:hypothetical protein